jgi:hypothetical protein
VNIRNRVEELFSSLNRLSPRERRAVGGLALALLAVVVVGMGYFILSGLEAIELQNESTRKALKDLERYGSQFMVQRRRIAALEVRMARPTLELNSFVEEKAKAVGVTIAESDELSPVEGERYTQRGLEVKLRKIKIDELAKLLKAIEEVPNIVQVTRLTVNSRWNEHEDLDVEIVVSTFERQKARAGAGRKRTGGRS